MKIQDSHSTDLLAKKGTVWRRLEGRSKKHKQGIYMTGKWEPGKGKQCTGLCQKGREIVSGKEREKK